MSALLGARTIKKTTVIDFNFPHTHTYTQVGIAGCADTGGDWTHNPSIHEPILRLHTSSESLGWTYSGSS